MTRRGSLHSPSRWLNLNQLTRQKKAYMVNERRTAERKWHRAVPHSRLYVFALVHMWFALSMCDVHARSVTSADKLNTNQWPRLIPSLRHFPVRDFAWRGLKRRAGGSDLWHEPPARGEGLDFINSLNRNIVPRPGLDTFGQIRPTYRSIDGEITGMWAVKLKFGEENDSREILDISADMIANQHGLENHGQIGELKGYYLFAKKGSSEMWTTMASAVASSSSTGDRQLRENENGGEEDATKPAKGWNLERRLLSHTQVEWQGHQVLLSRSKRGGNAIATLVSDDRVDSGIQAHENDDKHSKAACNESTTVATITETRNTPTTPISNAESKEKSNHDFYMNFLNHRSRIPTASTKKPDVTESLGYIMGVSSGGARRMGIGIEKDWGNKKWFPDTPRDHDATFTDPLYVRQWHLENNAGTGDCNVTGVWRYGITGKGVVVAVVDDGVQWDHPDLVQNYCPEGSFDLNANDDDPMPVRDDKEENKHGTRCAGEIAAAPNNHCGVGVAHGARFSGIRILDGPLTDSMEAAAFNKHLDINDIYSCSWGPEDDGKTVDGPHPLAQAALKHGIVAGRHGFGSIYIVASGNGGHKSDNCNYDGYANSIYTITIGAVDEFGHIPSYAEECASMLACTFSSGAGSEDGNARKIVTTDWTLGQNKKRVSDCTESHTGTSAATPLAAGMVALMLEVRPCLTWRDIQHIIVMTSIKIQPHEAEWVTNVAGFHHSDRRGFGLLNAWRLVNAARVWQPVPWLTSLAVECYDNKRIIPNTSKRALILKTLVTEAQCNKNMLYTLEQVLVTVDIEHPRRGDLFISLVCPSGTTSVIARPRKSDDSSSGLWNWTFSTVKCWGEKPHGIYRLIIHDTSDRPRAMTGELRSWKLLLYGSTLSQKEIDTQRSRIEEAMSGKYLLNISNVLGSAGEAKVKSLNETLPLRWTIGYCPPAEKGEYGRTFAMETSSTERMLKLIALSGCFLLVWGVYCLFDGTNLSEIIKNFLRARRNAPTELAQCRTCRTL